MNSTSIIICLEDLYMLLHAWVMFERHGQEPVAGRA